MSLNKNNTCYFIEFYSPNTPVKWIRMFGFKGGNSYKYTAKILRLIKTKKYEVEKYNGDWQLQLMYPEKFTFRLIKETKLKNKLIVTHYNL
jgi:hypothetical protein